MHETILRVNNLDDIDEVLRISIVIFEPSSEKKERYHNKADWLDKIANGLLVSASVENKIVGYAICYKKEQVLHIWNVGVLEEYRKMGIWRKMYGEIVKFATENKYTGLSLNTFREKFSGMYNFCLTENFVEYKTEVDPLSGETKSMFLKKL